MNNKQAKKLRRLAVSTATAENNIINEKIKTKQAKSGKMVMNSAGVYVEEIVPVITYTSVYADDSPKNVYKALKEDYYA